jgi:hypothetical protein
LAVRARALILAGCLLWASSALGDETTDFEKARLAYDKKDYVEASARFQAMLDPHTGTLKTQKLIDEAEFCWGAVRFALGDKNGAHTLWEKVIRSTTGQYQPDPLQYPTDVLNDFIDERKRLNDALLKEQAEAAARAEAQRKRDAEERARLKARVAELEKMASEETVVVRNSRVTAMFPFGVGQFQNGADGLGWFFLCTEGAAVVATFALFIPYRYNIDQANAVWNDPTPMPLLQRTQLYDAYAAVAQDIRTADFITLGALGSLMIAGIVQAQIAYKPLFTYTRKRKTSALWPSLAPLPGAGATIGVSGRF